MARRPPLNSTMRRAVRGGLASACYRNVTPTDFLLLSVAARRIFVRITGDIYPLLGGGWPGFFGLAVAGAAISSYPSVATGLVEAIQPGKYLRSFARGL